MYHGWVVPSATRAGVNAAQGGKLLGMCITMRFGEVNGAVADMDSINHSHCVSEAIAYDRRPIKVVR